MPKPTKTAKPAAEPTDVDLPPEASEDVKIVFEHITVTVPRDADDWPTAAELARLKAKSTDDINDWLAMIEAILGPRQWAQVIGELKRGQFYEFVKTFNETVIRECTV